MLKRILVEKRLWVIGLGAVFVLNVGAYLLLVRPLERRVAQAEQRLGLAERNLRAAEQDLAGARAVVTSLGRARGDLQQFYGALLPRDVNAASRMLYLRLAQLARECGLHYLHRSFASEHVRETALDVLKMSMELEGDYPSIRRFVHQLEGGPEFIVIDRVALGSGRNQNGLLALTIELSTYFKAAPDAR